MFFTSFVLFSANAELITEAGVEPACAAYETAELLHTLLRDNNKTHGNAYTLQTYPQAIRGNTCESIRKYVSYETLIDAL